MLLKNATICDYQGIQEGDVRLCNGQIAEIGNLTPHSNEEVQELEGKLLMPAMIDLNIAPKALSLSPKTLTTLSRKALKGGVGTALLSPYTTPPCSEQGAIELIKSLDSHSPTRFLPAIAALTIEGKISDINTLHTSGGRAIFARSDMDSYALMRVAQYAQMLRLPLICFCQDSALADGVMNEGLLAAELGLPSIPPYSQTKEVAKVAEMLHHLSHTTGLKLIFDTLAYPRALEIVRSYDEPHFYAQSSIHHLALDEGLCQNYNTAAKINPPLVDKPSQAALLSALQNGSIHTLTSLQCADYNSKKDQVFELAPFGIDTLELYFPLLYTYLHKAHSIPLPLISQLTSYNQAKILNLPCGAIEVGLRAELLIINQHARTTIEDSFSPYCGATLQGRVETLISGTMSHTIES